MAADGRPPEPSREATVALITGNFPFSEVYPDSFKPLPSYDDRNIYFKGKVENTEKDGRGCSADEDDAYVLKLYNNIVYKADVLDALDSVMLWASERGVLCCRPIRSRYDGYAVQVGLGSSDGVKYTVKIMRFIPGTVMDKLEKKYLTSDLSYSVGSMCGKLDLALQDFKNPVIENRRLQDWNMMHFPDVKQYIPHLREEEKRKMADAVVAMYEKYIQSAIPEMKKGVIHNDINGLNIICSKSEEKYVVCGLIDFSDCLHSCYLFELAIMMAYGMIEKEIPVEFVGPMFKGYQDVFPLSKKELNCLYYAVLVRLCQSAVNGEYRYTLEPWNTYLLTTPAEAWKLMNLLIELGKDRVEEIWGVFPE